MEQISIPPPAIRPLHPATLEIAADAPLLVTGPDQWSYAAELPLNMPRLQQQRFALRICLDVQEGILGAGCLDRDNRSWLARTRADSTRGEVHLGVPEGSSGSVIFENQTEGGRPARALIRSVDVILDYEMNYHAGLRAEVRGDKPTAISYYKQVLSCDPSHVGAIAGLGRTRFAPPIEQIYFGLDGRHNNNIREVIIEVRNPCNYRCFYCISKGFNNVPVQSFNLDAIRLAYKKLDAATAVTLFECGGGEPTVHPQFAELIRLCTDYGVVTFPSNNSQDPKRWLPRDAAERIFITSALHPEAEENIDTYLRFAQTLLDAGCGFVSLYISHPARMSKIPYYQDIFREANIPFMPIVFRGDYDGRPYPASYTEEEQLILGLRNAARHWSHQIEPYVSRIRNFRGIPCDAGHTSFYLSNEGIIRRCLYDPAELDAPANYVTPCGVKECGCGLRLKELGTNHIETFPFFESWAAKLGLSNPEEENQEKLAKSLGYPGLQTARAATGRAIYDALMAAYGKDEFPE